jgi:hypothetical protein
VPKQNIRSTRNETSASFWDCERRRVKGSGADTLRAPPTEVRVDSLYSDLLEAIVHAESIYARAYACAHITPGDFWSDELKFFRARVLRSAEEPLDSSELTSGRLDVLRECLARGIGGKMMLGHLQAFLQDRDVIALLEKSLTAEESDALAALA